VEKGGKAGKGGKGGFGYAISLLANMPKCHEMISVHPMLNM